MPTASSDQTDEYVRIFSGASFSGNLVLYRCRSTRCRRLRCGCTRNVGSKLNARAIIEGQLGAGAALHVVRGAIDGDGVGGTCIGVVFVCPIGSRTRSTRRWRPFPAGSADEPLFAVPVWNQRSVMSSQTEPQAPLWYVRRAALLPPPLIMMSPCAGAGVGPPRLARTTRRACSTRRFVILPICTARALRRCRHGKPGIGHATHCMALQAVEIWPWSQLTQRVWRIGKAGGLRIAGAASRIRKARR